MPTFLCATDTIIQTLIALFLAILFLQSGLDKIVDRRGNLDWLTRHFAKSPLASTVAPMFLTMTVLELAAGVCSAVGVIQLVLTGNPSIAFCGAVISAISFTALFLGQRVAKDYAGAAALVPYFLLSIVAIAALGWHRM